MSNTTPLQRSIAKAEKSVVRAAMGCVSAQGWAMESRGLATVVLFPRALVRLEIAVMRLRAARKGKR